MSRVHNAQPIEVLPEETHQRHQILADIPKSPLEHYASVWSEHLELTRQMALALLVLACLVYVLARMYYYRKQQYTHRTLSQHMADKRVAKKLH